MTTSSRRLEAKVLETRYVWGASVPEAMEKAHQMKAKGWSIEGNPAPMIWRGVYGTGVSITREVYDRN